MNKLQLYRKINPLIYKISPSLRNKLMDQISLKENKSVDTIFPKIKEVTLRISEKCNLRCPMCWWWGENGVGFKDTKEKSSRIFNELAKETYFDVIDQLIPYGSSVTIIGGEPFVRKDALDIIRYATQKLPHVSVVTNGTLITKDMAKELSKLSNLEITFSIDGPEKVHDRIRGAGNFQKTVSVIKYILQHRGSGKSPLITVNTTITPYGIDSINETIQQMERINVDLIKMQHLWFTDEETAQKHVSDIEKRLHVHDEGAYSHIMKLPEIDDLKKLSEALSNVEKVKHKVPVLIKPRLTKKEMIEYYTNLSFKKLKKCPIAWQTLRIESDGNVIFCPDEWISSYKIGNIKSQSITEVWNGELANKFRQTLSKDGLFPSCARCCVLNL